MRLVAPTLESRALLTKHGYQSVAHVPVLMAEDGTYPELENRYMRARALREWIPRMGTRAKEPNPRLRAAKLSARTLESICRKLCYFAHWRERRDLDVASIGYDDLLDWQDELIGADGKTRSEETKQPSTSNAYVSEACLYLTWLSLVPRKADGSALRPPFDVMVQERQIDTHQGNRAHKTRMVVEGRLGALAVTPKPIGLPTDRAVARWLRAMHVRSEIKGMMAEVALDSGMRISEINQMEVNTLPPAAEWRPVGGRVHFSINRGVKGAKIRPDSVVALRAREVSLSLSVARKLDDYRQHGREVQVRRWVRAGDGRSEQARRAGNKPHRLWLSESSNAPFANQQLWQAWDNAWKAVKAVMSGEPDRWSPHRARHWFAVEALVSAAIARHEAQGRGVPELTWLEGIMRDQIDLLVRPQLGHLSAETTRLYLREALHKLAERFGAPSVRWQDWSEEDA